jgi:GNAT superfamily N-acetyltransferase
MQIDYLADHPEMIPVLAAWHYQEWATLLPDWSLDQAQAELQSHTGHCQIPTTLVAVEHGSPLGSASLLVADLDGWEHLSPWVASVYVIPSWRGRGLGSQLVSRAVEAASVLEIPAVYLFTAGQSGFYHKLGWEPWQVAEHHGREVLIMRRQLPVPPIVPRPDG